jgi:hypothetical protein
MQPVIAGGRLSTSVASSGSMISGKAGAGHRARRHGRINRVCPTAGSAAELYLLTGSPGLLSRRSSSIVASTARIIAASSALPAA